MDILDRLNNYNPPDRTEDGQRLIAQDIWDAKEKIESLQKQLEEAKAETAKWVKSWDDDTNRGAVWMDKFKKAEAKLKAQTVANQELRELLAKYSEGE